MQCTTEHLEKAIRIAVNAHYGQKDKGGEPYIFHPLRVMDACCSVDAKIVAILHDVVEDTDVEIDTIRAEFPTQIAEALKLLTHMPDIAYMDYIKKIKENAISREVKMADLKDNSNVSRLTDITDKDIERLKKYNAALKLLNTQEDE